MFRQLLYFIFLSTFLITPVLAEEENTDTPQEKSTELEQPKFIELSDVPTQAAETTLLLKEIGEELKEDKEIKEIHQVLPSYVESIKTLLNDPIYENLQVQSIRTLQKHKEAWSVYNSELKKWKELAQQRIEFYEIRRDELEEYSALWSETHINATNESAPKSIQEHIANVIIKIEQLRNHAKTNYDLFLTDINLITTNIAAIDERTQQLQEMEEELSTRVFYQNQRPLTALFTTETLSPLLYIKSIYTNLNEKLKEFMFYTQSHQKQQIFMLLGSLVIIGLVGYFNLLYRKQKLFVAQASLHKKDYFFISLPFSTSIILIALLSVVVWSNEPVSVREMILFVILIPIIRIIQTVVHKKVEPYFYAYFSLYFLALMEKNAIGFDLDDRLVNIIIGISLIILIIKLIQNKVVDFIEMGVIKKLIYRTLPLLVLLLVISLLANLYGALLLSEKIMHGIFTLFHASIIFYVLTIILSGYVIIMLRRRISTASNILDKYAAKIERTTTLVIKLTMVIWWFKILTRILGLETPLEELMERLSELTWVIGNTTLSLESIVSFIMILIGTWVMARFVHVLLDVELFSRFKFSRGVPTAISTISNYIIVVSGILIAFSSLGVSTEQFALILGALGVGIGFGLRNIIANFVSGIIMVFERPIQIGDTIEVDNTMGKVLSIGTRASAVQTFDGSEVIVPNERFISSKIINWTLSDERRRKVLQIKVAFDSDIETVLEIMRSVALDNDDVLKDPEPLPTFQGFGDYYLEFKLYYWLTENLIVAQSDIAIAVYKGLKEANIATPMPIQELVMPNEKEG